MSGGALRTRAGRPIPSAVASTSPSRGGTGDEPEAAGGRRGTAPGRGEGFAPPDAVARLFTWLAGLPPRRALAAALALGRLSARALPPLHAVLVLLLAVPGLLALLGAATSWRRAGRLGLAWGFGHSLGGLYWVTEALLTDPARWWWLVPLAAPALAAVMALYAVLPALAAWFLPPGWCRLAGFAGAWTFAEMLRSVLFTGFPWNPLGGVWAFAALPVQGAAVVGVHGLSLLTLLLAGLPVLPDRRRAWLAGGAAALALAAFGAWRLSGPEPPGPPVRLVLVQAGVAQEEKWREDRRAAHVQGRPDRRLRARPGHQRVAHDLPKAEVAADVPGVWHWFQQQPLDGLQQGEAAWAASCSARCRGLQMAARGPSSITALVASIRIASTSKICMGRPGGPTSKVRRLPGCRLTRDATFSRMARNLPTSMCSGFSAEAGRSSTCRIVSCQASGFPPQSRVTKEPAFTSVTW